MSTYNGRISEQSILERHKKGKLRRYWDLNSEFAVKFVQRLIQDTIREFMNYIVTDVVNENHKDELAVYRIKEDLNKRKVVASIPMEILHGLLTEVVKEQSISVVRGELRSEVKLQGDLLICDILINDHIDYELRSMINELLGDMTIQSVYEDLLDEVQQDSLTHLIQSSIGQEAKEDRNKSIAKFDRIHGHLIVEQLSYQLLLDTMQSTSDPFASSPIVYQPFYELIMDILLDQYILMDDNARATLQNDPLARLHKNLFIDASLDVLLPELCDHLDEDMEDLNEYEISFL